MLDLQLQHWRNCAQSGEIVLGVLLLLWTGRPFLSGCLSWGGQLVAAICSYLLLRSIGLHNFTAPEAEGVGTLILLIGSIYAVVFAFAIFVIWGQFNEVENLVTRECGSLSELLRFSRNLNPDASHAIRRAVADYAQRAPKSEWEALGDRRRDQETEKSFDGLVNTVIRTVPANPAEEVMHAKDRRMSGKSLKFEI